MADHPHAGAVAGTRLPVAVIGAGPVGLAAAAHLVSRGERPLVLESGGSAGASVLRWGHVRTFSPWRHNLDAVASAMLAADGWAPPPGDEHPTGKELVDRYLSPLAKLPAIRPHAASTRACSSPASSGTCGPAP